LKDSLRQGRSFVEVASFLRKDEDEVRGKAKELEFTESKRRNPPQTYFCIAVAKHQVHVCPPCHERVSSRGYSDDPELFRRTRNAIGATTGLCGQPIATEPIIACTRPIERFGDVVAHPILGGLHHRYARI
jgi:hypothetical protein